MSQMTRSAFLVRSALATGAVYGAGSVSPFVSRSLAQSGDVEILNFALSLEHLEAAFYEQALTDVRGMSAEVRTLATEIRDNEVAHVDALTEAIRGAGGKPAKEADLDFGEAFKDEKAFLDLATTLEDTGVSAYNGAATALTSKDILATAGAIVQIEARHAALIRLANDASPAPDGFDDPLEGSVPDGPFAQPMDMDAVLAAVKPYIA